MHVKHVHVYIWLAATAVNKWNVILPQNQSNWHKIKCRISKTVSPSIFNRCKFIHKYWLYIHVHLTSKWLDYVLRSPLVTMRLRYTELLQISPWFLRQKLSPKCNFVLQQCRQPTWRILLQEPLPLPFYGLITWSVLLPSTVILPYWLL